MKTETAKNIFARPNELNKILSDSNFVQYAIEMFTNDDNGDFHPENLLIVSAFGKVEVREVSEDYKNDEDYPGYRPVGFVVKCNKCGDYEIACHDGGATYETQFCDNCGLEFTQIGECKNIEW